MNIRDTKPYNLISLYEKIVGSEINPDDPSIIITKSDTYPMQEDGEPDHLYFVKNQVSNLYKIGISADPERRFKEIQNACGMPIVKLNVIFCEEGFCASAKFIEEFLHNYFKHKKVFGEWFDLSKKEITALVQFFYHFAYNDGILLYDIRWIKKPELRNTVNTI